MFAGERYWPGRYILCAGHWMWTGRMDQGEPRITLDIERARYFVSARHAYETARYVRGLQGWTVRRTGGVTHADP